MSPHDENVRLAGKGLGAGLRGYVRRSLALPAAVALLGLGAAYLL